MIGKSAPVLLIICGDNTQWIDLLHLRMHTLGRFNSKFWCPGTEAVDAFTVDWGADINWIVLPLHLIAYAIQHAKACKAKGALAFPVWKSSHCWPVIWQHLAEFIHNNWCYLLFLPELLVAGKSGCLLGDALTVTMYVSILAVECPKFSLSP